jgi:hypothetical protein
LSLHTVPQRNRRCMPPDAGLRHDLDRRRSVLIARRIPHAFDEGAENLSYDFVLGVMVKSSHPTRVSRLDSSWPPSSLFDYIYAATALARFGDADSMATTTAVWKDELPPVSAPTPNSRVRLRAQRNSGPADEPGSLAPRHQNDGRILDGWELWHLGGPVRKRDEGAEQEQKEAPRKRSEVKVRGWLESADADGS